MNQTASDNGKTVGIIAYLTLIGWVIALVMHNGNKTEHGAFHIRQSLGLLIIYILIYIINVVLQISILGWILSLGIFVLWILAFIGAIQGEKKLVPGIGAQFQQWFKGLG